MRFILAIVFVVLAALAMLATYSSSSYYRAVLERDTTVILTRGMGAEEILETLHRAGAVPEPWKIALPVVLRKQYRTFKAGEYTFTAGTTPEQILDKIARGDVVVHKVTIAEGLTTAAIVNLLAAEPLLTGDVPQAVAEGTLYPDTYHFTRGESRAALVARMQQAMAQSLAELWAARMGDLPFATPQEAVTLASIIEKETRVAEERALVAGVYVNRLKKGMLLQADPTVVYGINPSGDLGRALTFADLKRDTPYNTYTRTGLPPGPICHPGKASLQAALQPAVTDYLYFVADAKGGHWFARTLAEHQKNVAEYRKLLRVAESAASLQATAPRTAANAPQ